MKVRVNSSHFVTPDNPGGAGEVDLDTPEGVAIFGGPESVVKYMADIEINKKMRSFAIEELKKEGKIPRDYQE